MTDKTPNSSPLNCYRYADSNDTIILKLIHVGKSITGALVYKMPQKNTSKGTIQGEMRGDLLIVRFTTFVDSSCVYQKVFKQIGNQFIEGVGETYNNDGRTQFKNIADLKFDDSIKLVEFNCE